MQIARQKLPHKVELAKLFEDSFQILLGEDGESNQTLAEWFDLEAMLEDQRRGGVLIEARDESGRLCGAAYTSKQNAMSWPDGHKAELHILATLPAFRGQGIGKLLLQAAETAAAEFGAKSIVVSTNAEMLAVIAFYEKQGYQNIGKLSNYYDNGAAVVLKKQIRSW